MAAGGLRQERKTSTRRRIWHAAVDLSYEHGFDSVTVAQIAASAEISPRTFNRYFPTKEGAVVDGMVQIGERARDALAARPADEPVWASLQAALESFLVEYPDLELNRKNLVVILSTPALRARHLAQRMGWADLLEPVVVARLSGSDREIRAKTIVTAGLMCLDIAMRVWALDRPDDRVETIIRVAFGSLDARE